MTSFFDIQRPFALLFSVILLLSGCVYPLDDPQEAGNKSDLTLTFKTQSDQLETKANTLEDGDKFVNLVVILTDENGNFVRRAIVSEQDLGNEEKQEYTVSFDQLSVGHYTVYAYANFDQNEWQADDGKIADNEAKRDFETGNLTKAFLEARELASLNANSQEAPAEHTGKMLLTAYQTIDVGVDNFAGEVKLLRPVVRFKVTLQNFTKNPIHLKSLSFSKFNVNKAYLIGREVNDVPVIPGDAVARSLPAYVEPEEGDADYWITDKADVYATWLYENTALFYKMFATVTMNTGTTPYLEKTLSYKGVESVLRDRLIGLEGMQVGDEMQVMLVTPNPGDGVFMGHNGSSYVTKSAKYDFADYYTAAANEILRSSDRAKYIHTLKRTTSGWELWHGSTKLFEKLIAEKPAPAGGDDDVSTDSDYGNPVDFKGYLIRFKNSNNKFLYNNGGKLDFTSNNLNRGNRSWVIYEVDPEGSILKLIDNKTSQVSTLTQMVRNQQLNVVLNVYYGVVSGDFEFEVVNTFWTDEGGHTASKWFN